MLDEEFKSILDVVAVGDGLFVFLIGAGILVESGIPIFCGKEGYWIVGSIEYYL